VKSIFDHVEHCGGYVVYAKFEEDTTRSPFSVALSVFDRLCGLVSEKRSPEEQRELDQRLKKMCDVPTLSRTVLPSIARINSPDAEIPKNYEPPALETGPMFHITIFAFMRLMRVLSSQQNPGE
jgi:hypothetical protein